MPHYELVAEQSLPNPLMSPEWVKWNERRSGLTASEVVLGGGPRSAGLRSLLYADSRGRVSMPPLSPYLPMSFRPSPTTKVDRIYTQWLDLAGELAEALASHGIRGRINLPPTFGDARPFQWAGFQAEWRYTFVADLQAPLAADASVRKRLRKAESRGYTAEVGGTPAELHACLAATEQRKGFGHELCVRDLEDLTVSMGLDQFRTYVVRDASGTAVSAGARLLAKDGWAIDWVQGTAPEHLENGVNQLMYRAVLEDLSDQGARMFDVGGANIRSVARAKSAWGFPTVPYISLTPAGTSTHIRSAALSSLGRARPVLRRARSVVRPRRN